jgi:hypothetical protein
LEAADSYRPYKIAGYCKPSPAAMGISMRPGFRSK